MMRKRVCFLIATALLCIAQWSAAAVDFHDYFENRTLRLEYMFAGDSARQQIFVSGYAASKEWAGRRVNLDTLLLKGTADLTMRSLKDGKVIFRTSFSSHFQEWVGTKRAVSLPMAYEHIILVPMPRQEVEITVRLFDFRERPCATLTHRFTPKDILVRETQPIAGKESRYIFRNGDSKDHIDIAILSEGYTKQELPQFFKDAERLTDILFSYEPFKANKQRFNVVAVAQASPQSGVSEPGKGQWRQTNLGAFFDFEDTERLLGLTNLFRTGDVLADTPWEHLIVLANTATYGGAGVYNSYEITAAKNDFAPEVLVHEFGHSFGGLGDEYFYDDQYTQYYYPDREPWNPNLTTLHSFFAPKSKNTAAKNKNATAEGKNATTKNKNATVESKNVTTKNKNFAPESQTQDSPLWGEKKWADMLKKPVHIPTTLHDAQGEQDTETIGLYEGGGYQSKGVYRPAYNCRMRTNAVPRFCPVCRRALQKMIDYQLMPME